MNPMWKVYKSKVMKTLNPEMEEPPEEEVCEAAENMTPNLSDEGPNAMAQLAKRMQGAGAKGWKSVSSLFTKDDEHQLLEPDNQPAADHPLAVRPEEPPPRHNRHGTGFWDNFATKWHQAAAMRQSEAGENSIQDPVTESSSRPEDGEYQEQQVDESSDGGAGNNFSKYATLGEGGDETPTFKWNFVTSKLAELKSRSMAKSN